MAEVVDVYFKKPVLGIALTCRFILQIEVIENAKGLKLVSQDPITEQYKTTIEFTIDCFRSIFRKRYPDAGGVITIYQMGAFDGDTRNIVVFYVLLSALCQAINVELEGFGLNIEQGILTIPATL